jgi:tetratricopeptide (TPR) repeat protein
MTFIKILRIGVIITASILISIFFATLTSGSQAFSRQSGASGDLGKIKGTAATQHEIVILLINKKDFERALTEANKIFDLNWPDDQEPLLLKELQNLSDQFRRQGQAITGLQLIERNSRNFKKKSSQIEILKEKGYLYKGLGQNEKALDCFQKARDLENSR